MVSVPHLRIALRFCVLGALHKILLLLIKISCMAAAGHVTSVVGILLLMVCWNWRLLSSCT